MQVKKQGVWGLLILSLVFFAGCGKAPQLSFEETLSVYNKDAQKMVEFIKSFDKEQVQNKADFSIDVEVKEKGKGKLQLNSEGVNDFNNQNSKANLLLNLAIEGKLPTQEEAIKADAQLALESLIKDYQLFVKLSDLKINLDTKDPNSEMLLGIVNGVAGGLKEQWISMSEPVFTEALKQSSSNPFELLNTSSSLQQADFYTGATLVEYEGQPAWKVDFNISEMRASALKLYDLFANVNSQAFSGNQEMLAQQEAARLDFQQALEGMSVENVEAYFVIYAKDKVKLFVKHADFIFNEDILRVEQEGDKKQTKTVVTINPDAQDKSTSKILMTLDKKKAGYAFDLLIQEKGENTDFNTLATLKGQLGIGLSTKGASFSLDLKLSLPDGVQLDIDGSSSIQKTKNQSFEAPESAQELEKLLEGLFGQSQGLPLIPGMEEFDELPSNDNDVLATGAEASNLEASIAPVE